MVKRRLKQVLDNLGYEVKKKNPLDETFGAPPLPLELEVARHIQLIHRHTMLPYARLLSLYEQAVHCERTGLTGDFVECGTWRGGAVGLMALANLTHGQARRHLHLFDSFEGLPEPDEAVDGVRAVHEVRRLGGGTQGKLAPLVGSYESVGTLQVNRELLEQTIGYDSDYLHYHRGWFQDTLPREAVSVGPVAILRLDGDWYASTKICLEQLYDKVVSGGFVIIDDYGRYEGCRTAVEEFMQRQSIGAFLNRIDSEGRYWLKP
jgi:O-methyltransferase